jgi:NAD(P)-dependent dehydrogenase (short-subunit alcohol dehydrogenase family)
VSAASGKVIAITGGARGIGYETAAMLLRHGAKVAIGDIDEARLKEAAGELRITTYSRLDVTDPESFKAFLDLVESELGPIDVLVNNAGIMPLSHLVDEDDAVTRRVVEINVLGVIFGSKEALKRMLPRGHGHIINIGSMAGEAPVPGAASYCGTKAAVLHFTETARLEHRKSGVHFSAIAPTYTNTELIAGAPSPPGFRNAEPREIAEAVVSLIEKPRPLVHVTRAAGSLISFMKFMPRSLGEWLGDRFHTDSLMLDDVDTEARAAYDARIRTD